MINEILIHSTNIVNKFDPMDLLSQGAPKDEYNQEIIEIIKIRDLPLSEFREGVVNIFVDYFDLSPDTQLDNVRDMANEIYASIHQVSDKTQA
jgi:hypothetical protein